MAYLRHHFGQPPVMARQGLDESVRREETMALLDGQLHEIAEMAAFLVSHRVSFVAGAIIPVDGGWAAQLAHG
jgi:NAD(P)-dependent dehydrogenase (short-subunit alcohol dehydrogenase family)